MAYAIMRCQKMKRGDLAKYDNHHWRKRDKLENRAHKENEHKNITKSRQGKTLCEQITELKKIHEQQTKRKLRKDAVVALEFVFAFSPEYKDKLDIEKWALANLKWIKEQVNNKLLEFNIEYDETTPHMHAVVATTIDNKFNAKKLTDKKYEKWQSSYAEYMEPFGLQRGISKKITRRKHTTLREYNEELERKNKELTQDNKELKQANIDLQQEHEAKMNEYKEQEEKKRRQLLDEVFNEKETSNYTGNMQLHECDDLFL